MPNFVDFVILRYPADAVCQLWRDFWDKNCFITWSRCIWDIVRWKNMWLGAGVNEIYLPRISCKSTKWSFYRYWDELCADISIAMLQIVVQIIVIFILRMNWILGLLFNTFLPFSTSWKCKQRSIFWRKELFLFGEKVNFSFSQMKEELIRFTLSRHERK